MLISADDVKDYLGLDDNTEQDAYLADLILLVTSEVENYCGRTFASATFTEYFDGVFQDSLNLKNYPITSITSIHDDGDRVYGDSSLISSSDYVYYADEGIVKFDSVLSGGNKSVKVVYVAGYATIPSDLKLAIIKRVAAEYIEGHAQVNAIKSTGDGSGEIEDKPGRLKKESNEVLNRYKNYNG